ncbi:hypothetical protein DY000_02054938 [Brassica cretica]|uniref:Uncharacterized protein n=1 Tax=Brassica cretica TaxID=69181 RepID=A0ABQ7AK40_BRACR|nr:hypothetical protein DY000_02054938 [Brassica cretica]
MRLRKNYGRRSDIEVLETLLFLIKLGLPCKFELLRATFLLHGSVSALRQLRFRKRLIEGSVYSLSGFDVTRSNPKFRLTDVPRYERIHIPRYLIIVGVKIGHDGIDVRKSSEKPNLGQTKAEKTNSRNGSPGELGQFSMDHSEPGPIP